MGKLIIEQIQFVYSPCNLRNFFSRNSSQARPSRQRRTMPLAKDLLHPSIEEEKGKCKLKRLVQSPNSYFMDVKCPGCYKITTVFSLVPTDRRESQIDGRMFVQKEGSLNGLTMKMESCEAESRKKKDERRICGAFCILNFTKITMK